MSMLERSPIQTACDGVRYAWRAVRVGSEESPKLSIDGVVRRAVVPNKKPGTCFLGTSQHTVSMLRDLSGVSRLVQSVDGVRAPVLSV